MYINKCAIYQSCYCSCSVKSGTTDTEQSASNLNLLSEVYKGGSIKTKFNLYDKHYDLSFEISNFSYVKES